MKQNIFQKISFLIYCVFMISILAFFVPFKHENSNYYSSILNIDGENTILIKLFFFLFIPTLIYIFSKKYLVRKNQLSPDLYKKKAKIEIYIFLIFFSFNLICVSYLFLNNYISESKKTKYSNEILEIKDEISNLNFRNKVFNEIPYGFNDLDWSEEAFLSHIDYTLGFKEDVYNYLNSNNLISLTKEEFDDKIKRLPQEEIVKNIEKDKNLNKQLALKEVMLDELNFFSDEFITCNIFLSLFCSFIVLYLIRNFVLYIKGMFVEIN